MAPDVRHVLALREPAVRGGAFQSRGGASMNAALRSVRRHPTISIGAQLFYTATAPVLRDLAQREQRSGKFTLGLSRAIDVLDLLREASK